MDSPHSQDHPLLRRRKFESISPVKLSAAKHRPAIDNLELQSIKPASHTYSYSSLRDLLPSLAVNSPKEALPGSDIRIRNRLVKQAAWAYLQPMSTAPDSTGGDFYRRFWTRVAAFVGFLCGNISRALDGTVRPSPIRFSRIQRSQMG